MDDIPFSVVSSGNAVFIQAFTIPLAKELEKVNGLQYRSIPNTGVFTHISTPKAIDSDIQGIFGILLVIPGWIALKIAEEIYDIKIRPAVRKIIQKADSIKIFSSQKKHKVFTLQFLDERTNILIILAAKEKSLELLEISSRRLLTLLPSAIQYADEHNSQSEVHLYVIKSGKINNAPSIHANIEIALNELKDNK